MEIDLETIDAEITEALTWPLPEPLTPNAWLWSLADAENARDIPCFQETTAGTDTSVSWQGDCAHDDGDTTYGTLLLALRDETLAEGTRRKELSYLASMDGVRDGQPWEVGGTGSALLFETEMGISFAAEVGGLYALDEGWASDDVDTSLELAATPTTEGYQLTLTGGVTPPGAASLYFWGLVADTGACPGAPFGRLSVRDSSSAWVDVYFGEDCSGCGTVFWQDEALGQTCPGARIMEQATAIIARFSEEIAS